MEDRKNGLTEKYREIIKNRKSDMSDADFELLLEDVYMMGFNEAADQYREMSDDIAFEMDLAN